MRAFLPVLVLSLIASAFAPAIAGEKKPEPPKKHRVETIDYGGFFGGSFVCAPGATFDNNTGIYSADSVAKGIVVQFSPYMEDGAIFDLDSLRIACAWQGGAPRLVGWWLNGQHGPTSNLTQVPLFATKGIGWAGPNGELADPRPDLVNPLPHPGPLPHDWARIKGYYRFGRETVFSYTVGACEVLEELALEKGDGAMAVARTFNLAPHDKALTVILADAEGAAAEADGVVSGGDPRAALAAAPAGAKLEVVDKLLVLRLPATAEKSAIKVLVAGKDSEPAKLAALAKSSAKPEDLAAKTKGGPALWKEVLTTKGTIGLDDNAYAVDAIGVPESNPWNAWIRPSAVDFIDATTAALACLNGDVFVISNIDSKLDNVQWRRFAAGLHAPLGLKIVDGQMYVSCRDGIYRLHDLDKDGEADYYELFNTDLLQTPSFHSFVCDLNTDPQGNFIFSVGGAIRAGGRGFQRLSPHQGAVLRLSKDGQKLDVIATGLRMPNGSAVSANGQITCSDNEGVWVPASPIHWVKDGDFLGCCSTAHGRETHPPKPLCFMPQRTDSSACSQVWVTSDKWGPLNGDLLHMSYGKAGLFLVYKEDVGGTMQGGVVRFPVQLSSSGIRGRFNPGDGQLYVCGLRMGQTTAVKDGGFDRIRYTGKPLRMAHSLSIKPNGVQLNFTAPLDTASASDAANYSVRQWNYKWTENYGSSHYSVAEPEKKAPDGDDVPIKSAKVSEDRKSVFLEIDGLKPVMQFAVKCKVKSDDDAVIDTEFMSTIHVVPAK
jgi:hypothetical protein